MSNPCFDNVTKTDCPYRHGGCAATCPKWKEYEADRNKKYEEDLQAKNAGIAYRSLRDSKYEKWRKHQLKSNRPKLYKGD